MKRKLYACELVDCHIIYLLTLGEEALQKSSLSGSTPQSGQGPYLGAGIAYAAAAMRNERDTSEKRKV